MSHADTNSNMRRVMIALVLTGAFMVVEVIGGILSGSLALLADGGSHADGHYGVGIGGSCVSGQ